MDNKNVFIAIALSMSVLLFWAAFFESPKPANNNIQQQKKTNENTITPNINESLKFKRLIKEDKYEDNVAGKFYVDSQCIDCDLCRETAPENFKREEDEGYSFVYKQPDNEEEEEQCREAMEGCPVEAIGDDGGD